MSPSNPFAPGLIPSNHHRGETPFAVERPHLPAAPRPPPAPFTGGGQSLAIPSDTVPGDRNYQEVFSPETAWGDLLPPLSSIPPGYPLRRSPVSASLRNGVLQKPRPPPDPNWRGCAAMPSLPQSVHGEVFQTGEVVL